MPCLLYTSDNARMNKADVLGMTGMYKEVMDLMRNIHIDRLPVDIHPYYYHCLLYTSIYSILKEEVLANLKR